jgi:hypothetical protein
MEIFQATLHGQNLGNVTGRRFVKTDLSNCIIGPSRGAQFIHCYMEGARFVGPDIRDILGLTATLNCKTFQGLELPAVALDGLLKLFSIGKGNDERRQQMRSIIDPHRLRVFDRVFPDLE